VVEAAEVDIEWENRTLLEESQRLLAACDRLIAAEEEILQLNDLSAETYVSAYEHGILVWQNNFIH
jgi:hypothetical protein